MIFPFLVFECPATPADFGDARWIALLRWIAVGRPARPMPGSPPGSASPDLPKRLLKPSCHRLISS